MQTLVPALVPALAVAATVLATVSAAAGPDASHTPWVDLQDAQVRLVAASDGLDAAGHATLGLQVRLADGWKTYWREPGEAGLPPRLDWSGSTNLAAASFTYPAPHRFESFGFISIGYAGEVVFPIALAAADPSRPVLARLTADFMVCEAVCVPLRAELALDLAPGASGSTGHAGLIAGYAETVPGGPGGSTLAIEDVRLEDGQLRVEARSPVAFDAPDLFVEADGGVGYGPPTVAFAADRRRVSLVLPVSAPDLAGKTVRITLLDGKRGLEQPWTLAE